MKIIIAVHHFPPQYTAGAERQAFQMARILLARGYAVRVICIERVNFQSSDSVTWKDDLYEGIPVRRMTLDISDSDNSRWEFDNQSLGEHLRQYLQEEKPDIFHLISGYLMTGRVIQIARQMSIPVVISLMDFWFLCPRITMLQSNGKISYPPLTPEKCVQCLGEERRSFRWMGKILPGVMRAYWSTQNKKIEQNKFRNAFLLESLQQANIIISNSKFLRSAFNDAGVTHDKFIFMRQGYDFNNFVVQSAEKTPSASLRVGYLGQIAWHKGVHVLFEALQILPDAPISLKVYGNVSSFPKYTQQLNRIAQGDNRINFSGTIQPSMISQALHELDVLVVPSLWYENSPNVILESFAHKTPVIASNLGGMAELVQHEKNGLVFTPGNAKDLAKQLLRLSQEKGLLEALGQGIEPVKSVAQEIDELERVYAQAIN